MKGQVKIKTKNITFTISNISNISNSSFLLFLIAIMYLCLQFTTAGRGPAHERPLGRRQLEHWRRNRAAHLLAAVRCRWPDGGSGGCHIDGWRAQ